MLSNTDVVMDIALIYPLFCHINHHYFVGYQINY
jgi:hypothetical protein